MSKEFDGFLSTSGIQHEHLIWDTPQQLGVAEWMNCSITEGIMTALSQSGLGQSWWEDAAMHWVYRKICIPSAATTPLTPFELFYGCRLDVSTSQPFGCLAYVHLQKDQ